MRTKYLISPGKIFFCLMVLGCLLGFQRANAQDKITVTGAITGAEDGMLLPGVSVMEKGTSNGTATDFDGNYTLSVAPDAVLVFSYIGFVTKEVSVNGQTAIDVVLTSDTQQLDEVIVVGYGTQKKELVTGANVQVSGDDLQKQSTTSALQALQGQTAGVQITSTSGQPGDGFNVLIRGAGSTGSNSPLYVVDGVLTDDISYLNNADIESISVLKDAASAAIYGSQASNGVVLVTTKKGKKGHAQITFDQYYGIQQVGRTTDMLNSTEYATLINEASLNSGSSVVFSNEDIANISTNTNWLDEMFTDAKTENYTLGITGGSDASSYSSSISYLNQEGVVGGEDLSNYERYNFRFNSDHKLYNDRITFGQNLSFAYIKNNGIGVGGIANNSLRSAFNASPLVPMYDADGNYYNTSGDSAVYLAGFSNPYASMLYSNQNAYETQKLLGNIYMQFELLDNLKFRTSLGLDYTASQGHTFSPIYTLSSYDFNLYSTASQTMTKAKSLIWDNLLTYNFDLNDEHHFETMLGTSSYNYEGESMYGSNVNLIFNDLSHAWLSNATNTDGAQITLNGGPYAQNKRMSYFGRVNYNFKETYLLNVTFRADGSSQFADGNRWGYFPSISGGWIMTNENFMEKTQGWLDYFKVRASWGQVGNQNLGNFQYLSRITYAYTNYNFGSEEAVQTPGAYPNSLANPDLVWETSEQLDLGFDARFFNSKLQVAFDWYNKTTKDWLISIPTLATSGVESQYINGGDITNKGVEVALSYRENVSEDFSFSVGVNGAFNKNEVGNIPTSDGIIHGETNQLWDNSPEFYRAEEGHPLGYFWGYQTAGVFQTEEDVQNYVGADGTQILPDAEPGDLIYVDVNGDGVIDTNDKTEIGSPMPKLNYGFNIGANYKAFDLSIQTNGVAGNQIVQSYRNQSSAYANYSGEYLDRWHGPGSSNDLPRLTLDNRNYTKFSDIYVKDGDFLRISNVTLGFDIAKVIKKENFFASQLRVYFSALNLYTFTKYTGMDPEVGYGVSTDEYNFSSGVDVGYYPRPKTYMVGLNIKF
ncbi:TonB-linked outer membrane protein, SusC/RagA family [Pustulibacterium marinum]|uniref:TonB-linked outer membrane protein, SusC/RagA family n=1 Tax=Pustulibacterium marinum TaxID=1224947 RepID=A0A1I7I117_9FLAO|nr:TonB-dependent receptor [Pustulibacterium marinum]SFU66638.1 TonB-linked outer membrane protein, SusC/RagA family [Pustulibacterium marinum]